MTADHNHRDGRHFGTQLFEDLDPLKPAPLEPDVEDDEGGLPRLKRSQRLGGIGSLPGRVALVFEHAGDEHADVGLVVDDQYVMRHG
jgi:hypothetical protein